MKGLLLDVRYGLRLLARSPGVSVVMVVRLREADGQQADRCSLEDRQFKQGGSAA